MPFPSLAAARQAPQADVFKDDERNLLAAAKRHLRCATVLVGESILDAEFHTLMASECLFKTLFCELRYSRGFRPTGYEDFGELKLAREFGHDIKTHGAIVIKHLASDDTSPLQRLMTLIDGGIAWNEDRYRVPPESAAWKEKVSERIKVVSEIMAALEVPDGT